MSSADPHRDFAVDVVRKLVEAGFQALWAGGCVRDFVLGRMPDDYDVATNALPDDVRNLFGRKRTVAVGASFGVIVVLGPKDAGQVEVATFRAEGPYLDGRRPDSVTFCTPEEDARRRDFTINGMFYDPLEDRLLDFVDGQRDIAARTIRAIGTPADRFGEDKLRMLRAVRFTSTLGFALEQHTADAVRLHAVSIQVVSAERIAQELKRMLTDVNRSLAVTLLIELRLLPVLLPELEQEWSSHDTLDVTLNALDRLNGSSFERSAAVLLSSLVAHGTTTKIRTRPVREICQRLKLSNLETDRIVWIVDNLQHIEGIRTAPDAKIKRLLSEPGAAELLKVARALTEARSKSPADVDFCDEYLRRATPEELNPTPIVTGDNLREWGLKPSPRFKVLLDALRDMQLNGAIYDLAEAKAAFEAMVSADSAQT